jgi:hypothetical protein
MPKQPRAGHSWVAGDLELYVEVFDVGGLKVRHNESTSAKMLLEGRRT